MISILYENRMEMLIQHGECFLAINNKWCAYNCRKCCQKSHCLPSSWRLFFPVQAKKTAFQNIWTTYGLCLCLYSNYSCLFRDHFVYGLSQWGMTLHCNVLTHWLSPYTEWSLLVCSLLLKLGPERFLSISLVSPLGWCTIFSLDTCGYDMFVGPCFLSISRKIL